jgi:CubicO group peptidase (beta-lactamase class C family)
MLKFGSLFLNDGMWEGRQLVPEAWAADATSKQVETKGLMNSAEDFGYGYNWWRNDFGGFSAHGAGGQFIFVVPAAQLAAVFTGGYEGKSFPAHYEMMKEYVMAGVK